MGQTTDITEEMDAVKARREYLLGVTDQKPAAVPDPFLFPGKQYGQADVESLRASLNVLREAGAQIEDINVLRVIVERCDPAQLVRTLVKEHGLETMCDFLAKLTESGEYE